VDIIYLNFHNTFDKVPYRRLDLKLEAHGISANVLRWTEWKEWTENWLYGRIRRVVHGGQVSPWSDVLSVVRQGSVLGPILFVLYVNDIVDSTNIKTLKFADDAKIYRTVNVEGIESLRTDLRNLMSWSTDWQMLFNIDKCKVVHLG